MREYIENLLARLDIDDLFLFTRLSMLLIGVGVLALAIYLYRLIKK